MDYKDRCRYLEDRIKQLNKIGIALSKEDDFNKLFEMIMEEAKHITNADGRTLYMTDGKSLKFEIIRNDSLNLIMGGTSGNDIPWPSIPLYDDLSNPNYKNVSCYVAHTGETSNIKDAYKEDGFDFSGTKNADKANQYRSKSFLTLPLKNHEDEIVGVMQLINAIDTNTGEIIPFSKDMEQQVESLASQAAVALTNKRLVAELKNLFESFIKLIATAIDKKSEYTGGHCERVPEICMMLADAVEKADYGKYKDFTMTNDERYELYIAAWLHDCGKVATPVHVVDKSTKLETITDRIEVVNTRFELIKRDIENKFLKESLDGNNPSKEDLQLALSELNENKNFIQKINVGGEFMEKVDQDKVEEISKKYQWINEDGKLVDFFSELEIRNLQISKGTLLPEEREIINDHISITIDMLEKLPYPKNLRNVPEFAGGHHETLDGKGYPKGLTEDEMSTQAKIMAIADIFEALTADDRPYKDGKKLSHAMRIMGYFRDDYHIDEELFEIFVKEKVYEKYAKEYVKEEQIDVFNDKELLSSK